MTSRSVALGTGSALPERRVANAELAARLDTSDEWIRERTGIAARRVCAPHETTASLAIAAGARALEAAGVRPADVDLVIVGTATPDDTFPATATRVQAALGTGGAAFDVAAVCSGFIYAVSVADAMLCAGRACCALVIGADVFSRILDWEDRGTAVLFGDGAGAMVLRSEDAAGERGILACRIRSDGQHADLLKTDGGPGSTGTVGRVRMNGREVFRHAVTNLSSVMGEVLLQAGLEPGDVDWVIPHQANARIIDATVRKLGLDPARVVVTVDEHANTSAASVPLALDAAVRDGRVKRGDLLLLEAMGGGFTWGAVALRW